MIYLVEINNLIFVAEKKKKDEKWIYLELIYFCISSITKVEVIDIQNAYHT